MDWNGLFRCLHPYRAFRSLSHPASGHRSLTVICTPGRPSAASSDLGPLAVPCLPGLGPHPASQIVAIRHRDRQSLRLCCHESPADGHTSPKDFSDGPLGPLAPDLFRALELVVCPLAAAAQPFVEASRSTSRTSSYSVTYGAIVPVAGCPWRLVFAGAAGSVS